MTMKLPLYLIRTPLLVRALLTSLAFARVHAFLHQLETSIKKTIPSHQGGSIQSLPDVRAAVIVPGFLTGKSDFQAMAKSLNNMGIPTVVVPMPHWHWLPCLGGRSIRPMLERIDFTVRHLASVAGDLKDFEKVAIESLDKSLEDSMMDAGLQSSDDPQLLIPDFSYTLKDCYEDCLNNPGADEVDSCPLEIPRGSFSEASKPMGKIALIGHSAGGWICRAYLSKRNYGCKNYQGRQLVHSLITLGSPHCTAPGPAFNGVEWVNKEQFDIPSEVRALAVGGTGYNGGSSGLLTEHSYAFCCEHGLNGNGTIYDGDGVTPIHSSLGMKEFVPHAETLILDDVGHFCWSDVLGGEAFAPDLARYHKEGRPWYGDDHIIEKWVSWL
eukprot:CAMPEP_0183733436 /NCGR_PEP_ID=MMETSP0737-20130205/41197_1 /TAXON_ID=385413 /ORGANISM="Thalassiosira miniscula, Strain CCMP1093" /LENGTH=382 /DNA_ID=CAMNT_0025966689 /DNA_START=34 /DNA_END=1185 /DNA_ORIENTATION=+